MKILKRTEITYNIDNDCIKTINKLSEYFDVSESRIIEILIKCPNDYIKYLDVIEQKERVKKEADHIDKVMLGRLVQDEMYYQKGDVASNVGESKWKDDDNSTEKNKEDTDIERQFTDKKKYGFMSEPTTSSFGMK